MFIILPTFSINTYSQKKCEYLVKTAWQICKLPGNFSSNLPTFLAPAYLAGLKYNSYHAAI